MANHERPSSRSGREPGLPFGLVLGSLFETDRRGMEGLLLRSSELTGFKGPLAEEIGLWHAEGLGKIVGLDTKDGSDWEKIDDPVLYRGVMYSLPLTYGVKGFDQRVLITIPTETGGKYIIGRPKSYEPEDKKINPTDVNKERLNAFNQRYMPSDRPYMINNNSWWKSENEQDPLGFFRRFPQMAALEIVQELIDPKEIAEFKEKAVEIARRHKRMREAETIPVDQDSLEGILDEGVFQALLQTENAFQTAIDSRERKQKPDDSPPLL